MDFVKELGSEVFNFLYLLGNVVFCSLVPWLLSLCVGFIYPILYLNWGAFFIILFSIVLLSAFNFTSSKTEKLIVMFSYLSSVLRKWPDFSAFFRELVILNKYRQSSVFLCNPFSRRENCSFPRPAQCFWKSDKYISFLKSSLLLRVYGLKAELWLLLEEEGVQSTEPVKM